MTADSVDAFEQEHRDLTLGLALVLGVRRGGGDRSLPPLRALLALELARDHLPLLALVLKLDLRVSEQVVVPDRVGGRASLRRDGKVAAVVLDAHQRCLAQLAGLRATAGHDDDGPTGVAKRRRPGPSGRFVRLDLLPHPADGAGLVLTVERHVAPYFSTTGATGAPQAPTNGSGVPSRKNE